MGPHYFEGDRKSVIQKYPQLEYFLVQYSIQPKKIKVCEVCSYNVNQQFQIALCLNVLVKLDENYFSIMCNIPENDFSQAQLENAGLYQDKYDICVSNDAIYVSNWNTLYRLETSQCIYKIIKIANLPLDYDKIYNINEQLLVLNKAKGYLLFLVSETQEFIKIRIHESFLDTKTVMQYQDCIYFLYNYDIMINAGQFIKEMCYIQQNIDDIIPEMNQCQQSFNSSIEENNTCVSSNFQELCIIQLFINRDKLIVSYLKCENDMNLQNYSDNISQFINKSQLMQTTSYKILHTPYSYQKKMFQQKNQHFIKHFIQNQLNSPQNSNSNMKINYKNMKIELKYLVLLSQSGINIYNNTIRKIYFNGISITSSKVNMQQLLYYLKSNEQASQILIKLNRLNINFILSEIRSNCNDYKIATIANLISLRNQCKHGIINRNLQEPEHDAEQVRNNTKTDLFKQVIKNIVYNSVIYFKDFILDQATLDFVKKYNICLLKYAIMSGRVQQGYMKMLLQHNVNVFQDKKGLTLIAIAINQQCIDSLEILLQYLGTKQFIFLALQVLVDDHHTALCYAIKNNFEQAVTLIINQYSQSVQNANLVPSQIIINQQQIKGQVISIYYGITLCMNTISRSEQYQYFDQFVQFLDQNTPYKQSIIKNYLNVSDIRYLDVLVSKLGIDGFVEGETSICQFYVAMLRYKSYKNHLGIPLYIKLLQNQSLRQLQIDNDYCDYFNRKTHFFLAATGRQVDISQSVGTDIFNRDIQSYKQLYQYTISQ